VDILPTPNTSNRRDPVSVQMYIRVEPNPEWFLYRFRTEPRHPVTELHWNQCVPIGEMPVEYQAYYEGNAVPGVVEPAGWVPEAPPAG
jgi:hypothetical protein